LEDCPTDPDEIERSKTIRITALGIPDYVEITLHFICELGTRGP